MNTRRSSRPAAAPTSWDPVADWYADYLSKPDTLQNEVVFPGTLRLLDAKSGKKYLDIACGEGAFSRRLAQEPGVLVDGFDASPSLIEKAKKIAPRKSRYSVADARVFSETVSNNYDGAVCILALQNIDPIETVFQEAHRVLKPGSPFVMVINHPCYRQPRQSGWGWDENRKIQYRRVDRYLSPYEQPIEMHPGKRTSERTSSFHRPLSTYVNALSKNGFIIDAMEEWVSPKTSDSGPRAKAENVARKEIPLFLAIRARRV
jgi:SAM-dependent methyltransferase